MTSPQLSKPPISHILPNNLDLSTQKRLALGGCFALGRYVVQRRLV